MEDMTLIGIILIVVGLVLAIPTCFISLIILGLLGLILIIAGETGRKPYQPPVSGPYPQQPYAPSPYQHQPYPPLATSCPNCGGPLRWVQQYSRWYCDYCIGYR